MILVKANLNAFVNSSLCEGSTKLKSTQLEKLCNSGTPG